MRKQHLFLLCMLCVSFLACRRTETSPTGGNIEALFEQQRQRLTQTFEVNAATGVEIVTKQDSRFIFPPNAFRNGKGEVVTGMVSVELIEAYDRGTMVLINKPTSAIDQQGNRTALISGGEFSLKATQNGEVLDIVGNIQSHSREVANFDDKMGIYQDTLIDGKRLWMLLPYNPIQKCVRGSAVGRYCFNFPGNNRGRDGVGRLWCNIDQAPFYTQTLPKLGIKLPDGFDSKNASVCIVVNGVISVYDTDYRDNLFQSKLTINDADISIVATIDDGGTFKYAVKSHRLAGDAVVQINQFTPTTPEQLAGIINALP